jgi:hypothetical protein
MSSIVLKDREQSLSMSYLTSFNNVAKWVNTGTSPAITESYIGKTVIEALNTSPFFL